MAAVEWRILKLYARGAEVGWAKAPSSWKRRKGDRAPSKFGLTPQAKESICLLRFAHVIFGPEHVDMLMTLGTTHAA
jgi:hypothetical protein